MCGSRPPHADRRGLRHGIGEGLELVWRSTLLRAVAAFAASFNFFGQLVGTLYVLYATRELSVGPAALGGIFAAFGLAGIVGDAGEPDRRTSRTRANDRGKLRRRRRFRTPHPARERFAHRADPPARR